MEYKKMINLIDDASNHLSKFRANIKRMNQE